MLTKNYQHSKKLVDKYLSRPLKLRRGRLFGVVTDILKKRSAILKVSHKYPTPFYLFDRRGLQTSIKEFKTVFGQHIPRLNIFYAVKSNPHPYVLKEVIKGGLGLDVSSGRELQLAIKNGVKKMIFTGPGKTDAELALAIKHRQKLIINLDSFTELRRLGQMLRRQKKTMRAGVRVYLSSQSNWNKFGIAVSDLSKFFSAAKKYPEIKLEGIQCHMSWNKTVTAYENLIKEIATQVKTLSAEDRAQIKFIDFGGGFETYNQEGYFPWTLTSGEIIKEATEHFGQTAQFKDKYYLSESIPLKDYAVAIGRAIFKYLDPWIKLNYYCEPGRIISNPAMHLVLKVMDIKRPGMAILDGGTNMIGYELFEYFYYPTVNLTRPSKKEIAYRFYGSLCTPYDLFGYYCYARGIKEGDIIIIPNQGAYTYTLAQNFIKDIPATYILS